MLHSRHHEEAIELLRQAQTVPFILTSLTHDFCHTLKVVDAVDRRDVRIAEAMIVDELTAIGLERMEIGVDSVYYARHWHAGDELVVGERHVGGEIQCVKIPIWIVKDEIFEERDSEAKVRAGMSRVRSREPRPPTAGPRFGTGQETRIDIRSRTRIDRFESFDLRRRQAARCLGALTEQDVRVELAAARIGQDA